MLYQIKSYLKFWFKSTNAHGVHSPFVYDLVTKCFYDKTRYSDYSQLKNFRKHLIQDNSIVVVKDFGEGSKVFKSDKRKVSRIVKNAGVPFSRQRLLFRLVKYFNASEILELGTSLGLATAAMAFGNPEGKLTTVEGCPETAQKAKEVFDEFKLKNINLHNETFEDFLDSDELPDYDLIYLDGNHNREKTLEYFDTLLSIVHKNSVIVLDDIYWSPEMTDAWNIIRRQLKVTVSIDAFFWGIVFFRREQPKQHFSIRL